MADAVEPQDPSSPAPVAPDGVVVPEAVTPADSPATPALAEVSGQAASTEQPEAIAGSATLEESGAAKPATKPRARKAAPKATADESTSSPAEKPVPASRPRRTRTGATTPVDAQIPSEPPAAEAGTAQPAASAARKPRASRAKVPAVGASPASGNGAAPAEPGVAITADAVALTQPKGAAEGDPSPAPTRTASPRSRASATAKAAAAAEKAPAKRAPARRAAAAKPVPEPSFELPEIDEDELERIAGGMHTGPHSILGQHPVESDSVGDPVVAIRVLRPMAEKVTAVLATGARIDLAHIGHGVWQGVSIVGFQDYLVETVYPDDVRWTADDPYRYLPSIGELDLYLFGEGRHERLWHVLGAHYREHWGVSAPVKGVSFTVWAPHARIVRVIGDFNGWHGILHTMRRLDSNGVWELFVPGLEPGSPYKFQILTASGEWVEKADPMAQYTEVPPATASVVGDSSYEWSDGEWLSARAASDPHSGPMSVYEMHLGSWRPGLGYRELADPLVEYLTETGYTHVEFLPLAEHPFGGSWGYQVSGYYAPTSRFGHPDDLRYLIDRLHQAGIGVLLDWVPAHFPKDAFALARFDGQPLYEHTDPRRGEHQDWGTLIFDFGESHVRNFLVANALYWLEEFHVDGLRVDAVASMLYLDYSRDEGQWLPNEQGGNHNLEAISFLQEVNATAYKLYPGIVMIAEESTSWDGVTRPTSEGGLGFGLKWNMGWMNDSLRYMHEDPMYRSYHQGELTFSFLYAFSENYLLPISHDEVVHGKGSLIGKMPGDHWQKLANARAYLAYQWAHPGKQLLFMGQEFGQISEWSEERGLDWWILDQPAHRGMQRLVSQLNRIYRDTPALWEQDNRSEGFQWIDGSDTDNNVVSFLRWDTDGNPVAAVYNFGGEPLHSYRVGLPFAGEWQELLNTDAEEFGGSGVGNYGVVTATEHGHQGHPASAELTIPALGALYLTPRRGDAPPIQG